MINMTFRIARIFFIFNVSFFEYLKKSIYLLIRQIDIHDSRIRQQNFDQLNYVIDQIRQRKQRVDDRLMKIKHKNNDDLKEMQKKIDKNLKKRFAIVK